MARLTQQQALEAIIKPRNAGRLVEARNHEQRLVMHTAPITNRVYFPQNALREFQLWVRSLLPQDKYDRFIQLLTVPFDTVESTKSIFDELSKVFDTQDGYKKYDFVNSELADDFLAYTEKIGDDNFWLTRGFSTLKNAINSLIVVDLPTVQTSDIPEPYYFILKTPRIIDLDVNERTGNVEYVSYHQGQTNAIVICDEFYRVFVKDDTAPDGWKNTIENQHTQYNAIGKVIGGLGYCPVEPFYKIDIEGSNGIDKRAPITDILGKLDWLLLWRTSVKYFELYAAWPPFVSFETECHYTDDTGAICQSGKIKGRMWDGENYIDRVYDCPACKKKEMIGPGTFLTIPTPRNKDDFNMMDGDGPIKAIQAPVDTLDYVTKRITELEDEIFLACVGYDGETMNKNAINQDQVHANFESKEAVLDTIKIELQRAQKFALDTIARLRYGNYFIKSTVDWGNEYFLKSVEALTNHLKAARENGMPMYYIANVRNRIIQTKSKNNPDEQKRDYILSQLEPMPDLSIMQVTAIKDDDPINYTIKLNFTTFIAKFERENANIVEFGSLIDFNKKIEIIYKKLVEYATEQRKQAAGAQPNNGGDKKPS